MGEMNRRTVILIFLIGLPTFGVIGPRFSSVQHPIGAAPQAASSSHGRLEEARPLADPPSGLNQEAWFRRVHQQLLDLGAVYLRLERWNGTCPVYQFRCDLRQGPGSGDQTSIEAFSGSAEAAADYVLLAARRWSSRSHPAAGSLRVVPATGASSTESRSESDLPLGRSIPPGGVDGASNAGFTREQPLN